MFCSPFVFSGFVTRNFLALRAGRSVDVHFGLLLPGFGGRRWRAEFKPVLSGHSETMVRDYFSGCPVRRP
jgi:hypothetical protein